MASELKLCGDCLQYVAVLAPIDRDIFAAANRTCQDIQWSSVCGPLKNQIRCNKEVPLGCLRDPEKCYIGPRENSWMRIYCYKSLYVDK